MGEDLEYKTTIRIKKSLGKMVEHACVDREISFNTAVVQALELWLSDRTGLVPGRNDGLVVSEPADKVLVQGFLAMMHEPSGKLRGALQDWLTKQADILEGKDSGKRRNG